VAVTTLEALYKQYSVLIEDGDTLGSGCLLQVADSNTTLVLTAKHCLTSGKDRDLSMVSIKRHLDKQAEIFSARRIFVHDEHDLAIITIDKVEGLKELSLQSPLKGATVTVYGYPAIISKEHEPRENLQCVVSFHHGQYFEVISDHPQFTFQNDVKDNLEGLSGSGVFIESGNCLTLAGLFFRLKAESGAFQKYCSYDAATIKEFIACCGFKADFDSFDLERVDQSMISNLFFIAYKPASANFYLQREIDLNFRGMFSSPKNIWISGVSGVGKTTLISRNLDGLENSIFIDLSAQGIDDILSFFQYINDEIVEQKEISTPSSRASVYEKIVEKLNSLRDTHNN